MFWVWTFPSVGLRFLLVTWREVAWNPRWLLGNIWAQPSCGPFRLMLEGGGYSVGRNTWPSIFREWNKITPGPFPKFD